MPQTELRDLLADAVDLGRLSDLTFSTARVVSTRAAEQACGGVVQGSWLLAVQASETETGPTLLLRVGSSTPAKSTQDDAYRDYGCEVIGVFGLYDDRAVFSAQVDSIGLPGEYRAFVPSAAAMSQIASFSTDPDPNQLRIGVLRFSPARLSAARSGRDAAAVNVNVNDFVGRRTAVFGMTRSGKMGTLTTRIPVPVSGRFPAGWATIGDLAEGDKVYAADGSVTTIIDLSEIQSKPVHEVHLSDGQVIECGPEHLWKVSTAQSRILKSNRDGNKVKAEGRSAAAVARTSHVDRLRNTADLIGSGTYATLADIARITDLGVDRVRAAAKASGLDEHLASASPLLTTQTIRTMKVYRTAEAWPRVVARSLRDGVAADPAPDQPLDEWLPLRALVVAATGRVLPYKNIGRFHGSLKSVESKLAEVAVASSRATTRVYPAAELILFLADYIETHYTGSANTVVPLEAVVSTKQMLTEVRSVYGGERANFAIRTAGAIQGRDADLLIDPYLLGAWLGDGTSTTGQITVGAQDIDDMRTVLGATREITRIRRDDRETGPVYVLTFEGLATELRTSGVFDNKHIPAAYRRASAAQRLAVLQGLMDTDGTVAAEGNCELSLSDKPLAIDALELIRSLGIKASVSWDRPASYRDADGNRVECKDRHRIKFTTSTPVFRLPRKAARIKAETSARNDWIYITDITVREAEPMRCISIAHPEALYLTDGFVPTHNSSTIKTIASAIVKQSAMTGTKVGQIIFDPQGEYAEVNAQDGTALRLLGDEDQVHIYRSVIDPTNPQDRRLLFNFFDHSLLDVAWDIVQDYMRSAASLNTQSFCSVVMDEPDFATRNTDWLQWSRTRLAFYALLYQSGFTGIFPNRTPVWFTMSEAASSAYRQEHLYAGNSHLLLHQDTNNPLLWAAINPEQCSAVTDWFMGRSESMTRDIANSISPTDRDRASKRMRDILGDCIGSWDDPSTGFWSIAQMTRPAQGDALSHLRPLIEVHDPDGHEDVTSLVWEDMVEGRLVVVDLSVGSEAVTRLMSERIANRLLSESSAVFRAGLEPVRYQMIVEEAHNLFERGRMSSEDPWVRIAKEGAKYGIGLIYATQEVLSIDQRILANTHNWVVAHLNSDNEISELAKYYDFATFSESIRRSEDVGYVRLKTLSSPFIVPIQFDRFDHHAIDSARAAQGLAPLEQAVGNIVEPVAPVILQHTPPQPAHAQRPLHPLETSHPVTPTPEAAPARELVAVG